MKSFNGPLIAPPVLTIIGFYKEDFMIQSTNLEHSESNFRPFQANIPEADLNDLRQRLKNMRWPDKEVVSDLSHGVPLTKIKPLIEYWATKYDWKRTEKKLNALPQFMMNFEGLDIHFIHVKSKYPNAMPVLLLHGWPGSFFELSKLIEPLTENAEDPFDVVIPSMPGFGFSGKPSEAGWSTEKIAKAYTALMEGLGYENYVAQGGDFGAFICNDLGRQKPKGLLGIHVNLPSIVTPELGGALQGGQPLQSFSAEEKTAFEQLVSFHMKDTGYLLIQATRPQTIGYLLDDSPGGLAAWMYDYLLRWTDSDFNPESVISMDDMLDNFSLYWLTKSATSSVRLYAESKIDPLASAEVSIPAAISVFPREIYQCPKSWAEKSYHKLMYYNKVEKGGHFAAWEQPEIFAKELCEAFRPLRKGSIEH
jgi:pimeloyl-ACP methyl ester carboxylesterase